MDRALIATAPDVPDDVRVRIEDAVRRGGGTVAPLDEANGLVWLNFRGFADLQRTLGDHPGIKWVQLPIAGVDSFARSGVFQHPAVFTSAKGSFAGQVSEHALMLMLACLRSVAQQARTPNWQHVEVISLHGRSITILGGGGITRELIRLLRPFECRVRVLRRRADPVDGADETLPASALHTVLPDTDILVLALALTPETRHIVGAAELALLPSHAVIVNVARGPHIDTDALSKALRTGEIAGAGLDVTDPEPLPDTHPLWSDHRVLITSHSANSTEYVTDMLCERVEQNVARLRSGKPLTGVIDASAGY